MLPVYNITFQIVKEKESKTKESMRMMGMTDTSYWLSWFAYYTLINTIISLVGWLCLCINVIQYSTPAYVFLYMWLFGESVFGQIVFL
jgi:ATP-binding cassette subfamily A (ABC1) protein 3